MAVTDKVIEQRRKDAHERAIQAQRPSEPVMRHGKLVFLRVGGSPSDDFAKKHIRGVELFAYLTRYQ